MEQITLNFKAEGQKLTAVSKPQKYASNTVSYILAEFDLDTNWKSFQSVRAVWHNDFSCISMVLDGEGKCVVPHEVLEHIDEVYVNLVGSDVVDEELTDRLTTYPLRVVIIDADAFICGTETAEVTPSQFEQFIAIVDDLVHSVRDIDRCELNADYTLTIYYTGGTSDTVGPIRGEQGAPGPAGNGIQSVAKIGSTGTDPVIDTYRITYTNGTYTDFTVTNGLKGDTGATGNGIESVYLTGQSGAVKTYTILFTDGTTTTFDVTDGEVTNAVLDEATIVQTNTDNVPYLFRPSGGDVRTGRKEFDTIVGGTVGWNQLLDVSQLSLGSHNGITVTRNGNFFTLDGTCGSGGYASLGSKASIPINENHVYLFMLVGANPTSDAVYTTLSINGIYTEPYNPRIIKATTSTFSAYWRVRAGRTVDNYTFTPCYYDLTQMFGSTIADYVYTLESGTAGTGVAWLRANAPQLFKYNAYDAGSLVSVSGLTSHDMVGFNQWDEEWEQGRINASTGANTGGNGIRSKNMIPIVNDATYHVISGSYTGANAMLILYYDADGNYISYDNKFPLAGFNFKPPANASAFRINVQTSAAVTYNNDICINLSDASLNGTYKPYVKHSYPLDSDLVLRGIPKLDASNNLYYDGDTYASDGTVTRRYGYKLFDGTNTTDGKIRFTEVSQATTADGTKYVAYLPNNYGPEQVIKQNALAIATGYDWSYDVLSSLHVGEFDTRSTYTRFVLKDQTVTSLSALDDYFANNSMLFIYELATPTTETADPYTNPQIVDPSGTEEYVGSPIPVGHETDYPMTLTDTMPTANGTYTLNLTVANGKRSVSWT